MVKNFLKLVTTDKSVTAPFLTQSLVANEPLLCPPIHKKLYHLCIMIGKQLLASPTTRLKSTTSSATLEFKDFHRPFQKPFWEHYA